MPGGTGERLLRGAPCPVVVVPKDHRTVARELHRIGVAYDGSAEAETALRAAADLVRATGGELRVIRVLDLVGLGTPTMMSGMTSSVVDPRYEDRARQTLDDAVAGLPEDVDARGVFLTGDPADELAEQTGTLDLLVSGSRGYGPLRAVMAGGVVGRVLREAACPVVVLPRGVETPLAALRVSTERIT